MESGISSLRTLSVRSLLMEWRGGDAAAWGPPERASP